MQIARLFSRPCERNFQFLAISTLRVRALVLLKRFNAMGKIKTSTVMTTQESKLAKELDRRLQEYALQNKNKICLSEIRTESMDNRVRTPLRIHQHSIQRAQFYTGDA
jgi:hypothetical protein